MKTFVLILSSLLGSCVLAQNIRNGITPDTLYKSEVEIVLWEEFPGSILEKLDFSWTDGRRLPCEYEEREFECDVCVYFFVKDKSGNTKRGFLFLKMSKKGELIPLYGDFFNEEEVVILSGEH